jgi:DNA primase large subunit
MNDETLRDIKYEIDKISFDVDRDKVVKVDDLMKLLSIMLEKGEAIISKDELKSVVDDVLQGNYKRMLDELWKEIDKRLED